MLYPTDEEAGYPEPPVCPLCHQRCDTIYRTDDGTIVGLRPLLRGRRCMGSQRVLPGKGVIFMKGLVFDTENLDSAQGLRRTAAGQPPERGRRLHRGGSSQVSAGRPLHGGR